MDEYGKKTFVDLTMNMKNHPWMNMKNLFVDKYEKSFVEEHEKFVRE